jgi:hypothetical protein
VALTHPVTRQKRTPQFLFSFDQVLERIASANPRCRVSDPSVADKEQRGLLTASLRKDGEECIFIGTSTSGNSAGILACANRLAHKVVTT